MEQSEISKDASGVARIFRTVPPVLQDYYPQLLILLHVFFWTLIPTVTQHNAPLDVLEGFAWGHEWQWGTYKHPPLQSWLLEITGTVFGTSGIGYFGLAALCSGIALWAVYKTATILTDKTTALLATALTESILYFTFLSTEFNHNSLQLMLWALAGYAFVSALVSGKTRSWIALGIIFAAGFYAKYFMALCGVSFAGYLLIDRESRRWLIRPQPYLALVICGLLLTPHLMWLQEFHYLPFTYASSRLVHTNGIFRSAVSVLSFAGAQIAALIPAIFLGRFLVYPFESSKNTHRTLIRWLAFAPVVLAIVPSFISGEGLRSMWGVPILTFVPLWFVTRFRIHAGKIHSFAVAWIGCFLLVLTGYAGNQMFGADLGFKPTRGHYPGREEAEYFYGLWKQQTTKPLIYVVGDEWESCNVAFYSPMRPRPHVWIYGSESVSPWVHEEDVLKQGAVIVWTAEDPKPPIWVDVFLSRFPGTTIQPNHRFNYDVTVGSAILLPKP